MGMSDMGDALDFLGKKHWRPSAAVCNGTCVFGVKSWQRACGTALQLSQFPMNMICFVHGNYKHYCKKLNSLKHLVRTNVAESHN